MNNNCHLERSREISSYLDKTKILPSEGFFNSVYYTQNDKKVFFLKIQNKTKPFVLLLE